MTPDLPQPLPRRLDKRLFDLAVVLMMAPVFIPVHLVIFIAMGVEFILRPSSRGPFLYREIRCAGGKRFPIYKFRGVRQDAIDAAKASDDFSTVKHLERIPENLTVVGRYLKKFYLDEAAQVFNIVRGDMSIVGPRPWPEAEYEERRALGGDTKTQVPGGLVGLVQAAKGTEYNTAELDRQYIQAYAEKSTLGIWAYDLRIMWRSLRVLLAAKGI